MALWLKAQGPDIQSTEGRSAKGSIHPLHNLSGAPITREEVCPGKKPENQFSMELFEAWA